MTPAVVSVRPLADHKLFVEFCSGESGVLDLSGFLTFGLFRRIADPAAFCRVRVAFDTVEWDVGVDLDPEFVYRHAVLKDD